MSLFKMARKAWAEYKQYTKTVAELSALSDRELRDLGVSRFDIRNIAHEATYG